MHDDDEYAASCEYFAEASAAAPAPEETQPSSSAAFSAEPHGSEGMVKTLTLVDMPLQCNESFAYYRSKLSEGLASLLTKTPF